MVFEVEALYYVVLKNNETTFDNLMVVQPVRNVNDVGWSLDNSDQSIPGE